MMSGDGAALRVLRRRVESLDGEDRPWVRSPGNAGLIEHLVAVLDARTGESMEASTGAAAIDPAMADDVAASCRLLARLGRAHPELVAGTLRWDAQQWIGTGRHAAPEPAAVVPATPTASEPKPFGVGLFTSTAGPDGRSPWRVYLEAYRGSDLFPLPWTGWALPVVPPARVRELASARDWVELVTQYPAVRSGLVHPNWAAVAKDYDGVHFTFSAVVAIQGVPLRTAAGPTRPGFWDVESTFWLRWSFAPARRDHRADAR
jgi:hypothetical protein